MASFEGQVEGGAQAGERELAGAQASILALQLLEPALDLFGLEFGEGRWAEEGFDVQADDDFVAFVGGGFTFWFDDVGEPVI
jgi:hypothetical protein